MKLDIGILAGGKSSRMGQNKALLTMNNKCFLDVIAEELSTLGEVLVSVDSKTRYEGISHRMVEDCHRDIGPMEGIYQTVRHAGTEYVFVCGADMPFLKKELVQYMAEFVSSDYDCFVLEDEERIHPLCAIYSKAVLPVIEELIAEGNYRLMEIFRRVRTKYIKLELSCFSPKLVRNINTKEEYVRLVVLPCVFCVSGIKDSGKTGLIVKLINEFIREGYTVAAIKHDGHDYEMDREGTDTYRFAKEGAVKSVIFSDVQYSLNGKGKRTLEEMIALCSDTDIVLIEGMKDSSYPKIEVVRRQISEQGVCAPESLICIATDVISQKEAECPVYGLDDISGMFLCVKQYFGLI